MADSNSKPLVLIVDDNPQNLQVIGGILKKDYRIAMATEGQQAIESLELIEPDLLLLDIMMPGMDGYELCREIKKNELKREIPVIFVTAKKESKDLVKGFEYGAVDYITKPINSSELLVRVKNHISLKRAKDKLSRQALELKEINEVKDKLFSIISHDLRGPVANLKMYISGINSGRISLDDENIMSSFTKTIDETYYLVDNLLNWSRHQRNKIEIFRMDVWLKDMVDLNFSLYSSSATLKQIKLINNIPENLKIQADENMIKTILRNLINNSIKFTPSGGSIEVSCLESNDEFKICIKDSGVGMPKETADSLFDDSLTLTTKGTDNEKGSGLGLSICKSFVEMHDGKIWVESEEGKGSLFYFTISKQKPVNETD